MVKWLVNRESLPGKLQANTKLSSDSLKIIQKYQSKEVVQLYEAWEKMAECYFRTLLFQFLNIFEDYFAVLPLAFSMLNSPV